MSVKQLTRSALVGFSAPQMFALVNAIEDYPQFMDGCISGQVLASGEGWLEARLVIKKLGLQQAFTTRNLLQPPTRMTLQLVDGPFKVFKGVWQFKPLTPHACKVEFSLDYEFNNLLLGIAAGKWMEAVASEQVDALCRRAKQVYGEATHGE